MVESLIKKNPARQTIVLLYFWQKNQKQKPKTKNLTLAVYNKINSFT